MLFIKAIVTFHNISKHMAKLTPQKLLSVTPSGLQLYFDFSVAFQNGVF